MIVTKRDGRFKKFKQERVENAIRQAYEEVYGITKTKQKVSEICDITYKVTKKVYATYEDKVDVEQIQDIVVGTLKQYDKVVANAYEKYRKERAEARENTTDKTIMELLSGCNEYWKKENSNKNSTLVTTQRDYLAGIVSTDISRRKLIPKDIIEAHDEGIIHFHDIDYFLQESLTNCDLINLLDMLMNGTVINGKMIEKPHRFSTAMTIATQIITSVTSSTYGGATITLTHLAPFLRASKKLIEQDVRDDFSGVYGINKTYKYSSDRGERIKQIVDKRLQKELESGVQTFNYQINSMSNTNGQSPFLTVFIYLGEDGGEYSEEIAMIAEEFFKQRILGMKNEKGIYITQAFPKLIYVLEEQNIKEESKYYWLTKLAAKCTAKRFVPDYISEKKMKELKEEQCFPNMGCVDGDEVVTYNYQDITYVESFERMWDRFSNIFKIKEQESKGNYYIDLKDVKIFDSNKKDMVKCYRIIKNKDKGDWVNIKITNGRNLLCTEDHPLPVINKGRIYAKDIKLGDELKLVSSNIVNENIKYNSDKAWLLGFVMCDGCYDSQFSSTIALNGEDDIAEKYIEVAKNEFDVDVEVIEWHRDKKGHYKELRGRTNVKNISDYLQKIFGGIQKVNRHIPSQVFSWNREARLAFLAGIIDSDGYINNTKKTPRVQVGSINKEMAIQQMLLAQSLNMQANLYLNHYDKNDKTKIRYRVEFVPTKELVSYIVCKKKVAHFTYENKNIKQFQTGKVKEIVKVGFLNKYSYDVTTESDMFDVSGILSHNCRSFLSPWKDENGEYKFYGRFNQGVVTLSLPDVALSSKGDVETFWKLMDERTELCHKALLVRHNKLMGTKSDVAPILWQYGAFARLDKGEPIDKLLIGGYSSISLGYAGLYECVKYMTGESHIGTIKGKNFGLEVMKFLNKKCEQWIKEDNLGYGLYGSPIESTTYKFAKCLKKRFGVIEGITDRDYITNSYHCPVFQKINAFDKLKEESEFQDLSLGGAISYIECNDLTHNIDAVLEVIKYIYDNIMYAELNIKSDYCMECGFDGEMKLDDNLEWYCPNCGNKDQDKMNVARRTCGYVGTNYWNKGRTQEISEREVHLGEIEMEEE